MSPVLTHRGEATGSRRSPPRPPAVATGSGERMGRNSLLLLLGVPVALVLLVLWEFAMQTSAGYNPDERVRGWSVVLRELPGTILVLAPVVAGLLLGVRAARLGSRRGMTGIWAHSLTLFLVLLMIGNDSAESIMTTSSNAVDRALFPVAVGGAVAALLLCRRAVRRPAPPSPARLRVPVAVVAAGLGGAVVVLLAGQWGLTAHAGDFRRARVPGAVTVPVGNPGTYSVYAEGNAPGTVSELGVVVSDPAGGEVAVTTQDPTAAYLRKARGARAVAEFEATLTGEYRVAAGANVAPVVAPFAPEDANGSFAVGGSVSGWMRPYEWGGAALVVLGLGLGIALAFRTARRPGDQPAGLP